MERSDALSVSQLSRARLVESLRPPFDLRALNLTYDWNYDAIKGAWWGSYFNPANKVTPISGGQMNHNCFANASLEVVVPSFVPPGVRSPRLDLKSAQNFKR